jgi:hypothetical protein
MPDSTEGRPDEKVSSAKEVAAAESAGHTGELRNLLRLATKGILQSAVLLFVGPRQSIQTLDSTVTIGTRSLVFIEWIPDNSEASRC